MNIVTVGDGLGWSCEALIHLGHAIQKIAGRKDKTLSKLERIARGLSQCGELRPEYHSIVLGKPFLVPDRFPFDTHAAGLVARKAETRVC